MKTICGLVRGKCGVPGAAILLALGLLSLPIHSAGASAQTAAAASDSISRDAVLFPAAPCAPTP